MDSKNHTLLDTTTKLANIHSLITSVTSVIFIFKLSHRTKTLSAALAAIQLTQSSSALPLNAQPAPNLVWQPTHPTTTTISPHSPHKYNPDNHTLNQVQMYLPMVYVMAGALLTVTIITIMYQLMSVFKSHKLQLLLTNGTTCLTLNLLNLPTCSALWQISHHTHLLDMATSSNKCSTQLQLVWQKHSLVNTLSRPLQKRPLATHSRRVRHEHARTRM